MEYITKEQKIRFILSNHAIYNTSEKLHKILASFGLPCSDLDVSIEQWWYTNNWWDDVDFVNSLHSIGVKSDNYEIRWK
jgi:hypothetical protein